MTTFAAGFIVLFGLLIVSTCLWSLFKPQWLFEFARPTALRQHEAYQSR